MSTLEAFVRLFNAALCASTSLSLLFFFDASVAAFSPSGAPPAWLTGFSLSAVRLHAQLYAAALLLFAANNVLRLFRVHAVYLCTAATCLALARALFALAGEGPLLTAPELYQSLLAVFGILGFVNLVASPWLLSGRFPVSCRRVRDGAAGH